jgi:hypothetical protein
MYLEGRSVYNGHFELEILIERPVSQVWNQFVDLSTWVTSHRIETVAGEAGKLGSVTRVTDLTAEEFGCPPPYHHYCKIIKLVPHQQYVLKTYSEKGGSYGMEMKCFDDTRFVALNGKTQVIFNIFAEMEGDAVALDPAAMNLDGSQDGMLKNLQNLKRIVESA